MRQMILGLFAVIALTVAGAAPATACGYAGCSSPYYAPTYNYGCGGCYAGCGPCGGRGYDRYQTVEPVHQYYFVNQGPTYTGPGPYVPYAFYGRRYY
jgi:hypothetical protein